MGKYGGLSGQYYYKTKQEAERAMSSAKKVAGKEVTIMPKRGKPITLPGYNMRITGSRGFWTLTITKKRKK